MNSILPDWPLRLAAFEAVRAMADRYGPVVPWAAIKAGFPHAGRTYALASAGARGIFRPEGLSDIALTIRTVIPKKGRVARYEDLVSDDGFVYCFQGDDPSNFDNRLLARAYELTAPMIYLYGVAPGLYRPIWPVYVSRFDPTRLECVVVTTPSTAVVAPGTFVADPNLLRIERRYATIEVKKRLHQETFRHHVLQAYAERCSVCRMPRPELLEAAHILPDRDARGVPEVPNGLALCRLHHGAYDTHLLGIDPDGVITISERLMVEHDGPTLEHGLKGFNAKQITLPRRKDLRPRRDYLAERYERFRKVG